ncbi:MAG TPA: type II toxin-antitoxin system HicA family toxin [Chryseosolibacter sp.]
MTKTPSYTAKEIIKILERRGFVLDRAKGSHCVYRMSDGSKRVIVPMHNRDLPKGTFHSILKQAGIDKKDL